MSAEDVVYHLTYDVRAHPKGISEPDRPDGGACDAIVISSIIGQLGEGMVSIALASLDGRTGEAIPPEDLFTVWAGMAYHLGETMPDGGRRELARFVHERVREAILAARGFPKTPEQVAEAEARMEADPVELPALLADAKVVFERTFGSQFSGLNGDERIVTNDDLLEAFAKLGYAAHLDPERAVYGREGGVEIHVVVDPGSLKETPEGWIAERGKVVDEIHARIDPQLPLGVVLRIKFAPKGAGGPYR